jgi:hypothetical protein
MSRKRRSKRHIKRSIKRYNKNVKTRMRIRRNMYKKKHKKTQRGGVLGLGKYFPNANETVKGYLRNAGLMSPSRSGYSLVDEPLSGDSVALSDDGITFIDSEGNVIDIGVSSDENTLNGMRYLKAIPQKVSHVTKALEYVDGINFYYVIISKTNDTNGNVSVECRRILDKTDDNLTIETVKKFFILPSVDKNGEYIIKGNFPQVLFTDGKIGIIVKLISVNLEDIKDIY